MTYLEEKAFVREKCAALKIDLPSGWYLPMGKNVLVARLPTKNRTEGGLWLADTDTELPLFGVLVSAGLAARDLMADALIEIGDVVKFGKFEGAEDEFDREAKKAGRYLLQMKMDAVSGSIEADKRAEECDIEICQTPDGDEFRVWTKRTSKPKKKAA